MGEGSYSQKMEWDEVNRMKRVAGPTNGAAFTYRADGLRTEKVTDQRLEWIPDVGSDSGIYDWDTTTNKPTFRCYYDGQMPVEEDYAEITPGNDPFYDVTRYGLGARGVDMIEKETLEDTVVTYPVYDGHGNMLCTLTKSGASYGLSNWRYYDVWGDVNSGDATGDPAQRYCANLGHQQDDESGLIYMRARFYEPTSGRFVSEDPARDGLNWYGYCANAPVNRIDASGCSYTDIFGRKVLELSKWGNAICFNLKFAQLAPALLAFWYAWVGSEAGISGPVPEFLGRLEKYEILAEATSVYYNNRTSPWQIALSSDAKSQYQTWGEGYSAALWITGVMLDLWM